MPSKTTNPAAGRASEVLKIDRFGRLIVSEPTFDLRSIQVRKLMLRFGLTPEHAALIAELCCIEGRTL